MILYVIHGKPFKDLQNYVESRTGHLVPENASSRKLKLTNAIIGLVKRTLDGDDLKNLIQQLQMQNY